MTTAKNPLYLIRLEDYAQPRCSAQLRTYAGSHEDLMNFARRLAQDNDAAIRYRETIEGIDLYDTNPDITHTMAGQEIPLLTPATELTRSRFMEEGRHWVPWIHRISNCCDYLMRFEHCDMELVLLETETELLLCVRGSLTGLSATVLNLTIYDVGCRDSFPGICTGEDNINTMHLFTVVRSFPLSEKDRAQELVEDPSYVDLETNFSDAFDHGRLFL